MHDEPLPVRYKVLKNAKQQILNFVTTFWGRIMQLKTFRAIEKDTSSFYTALKENSL